MKMKRSDIHFLGCGATLAIVSVLACACSPGSLFGDGLDGKVQNLPGYHKMNTGCSQLDLSHAKLDVPAAKKFVECLNGGGSMGGVANLVKVMSDDELAPIVDSLNSSFLNDPKTLFQVERTLQDLESHGLLADTLSGAGELLKNDELIARSLAIFKTSYVHQDHVDLELLQAVEQLSTQLTDERITDGMDLAITVARARAFASLWDRLTGTPHRTLNPAIAEGLVAYANSDSQLGRELIDHLIDGELFKVVDQLVPGDQDGVRAKVPAWASLLNTSLAGGGRIAGQLNLVFSALQEPVFCMHDERKMNHAAKDMLREMSTLTPTQASSFIQRDKLIETYIATPLCAFPAALQDNYPALMELAAGPAIEPMSDVVKAFYNVGTGEDRPMADFLIHAMGDKNFPKLLPAAAELTSRLGWEDALLLSTVPQLQDRAKMVELLQFLIKPMPGSSLSVYQVLVQGIASVKPQEVTELLQSVQATDFGLAKAFQGIRAAYYINNAHPLITLARSSMAEAVSHPRLVEALLKASSRPEFRQAIRELSLMGRPQDGRLKDLLKTTLTLFHRYAGRGITPIDTLPLGNLGPAQRIVVRHDLSSAQLRPWRLAVPLADFGACRGVKLSQPWNHLSPDFDAQFEAVKACVDGDKNYDDLVRSMALLSQPADHSLHASLVEAYNAFEFSTANARTLARLTFAAIEDGRVLRVLKALPVWLGHEVLQPLVDLAAPVIQQEQAHEGLKRLGLYGAAVIKRPDIQKILAYVDDLLRLTPAPVAPIAKATYDTERMFRWIGNKECSTVLDDATRKNRVSEIIDEYENSAVDHGALVNGKLKQHWTLDELKAELGPIFNKFANPALDGDVLKSLLHFTARFEDPKQYPPGYLEQWLRSRANERRLISYIFPGETRPRVRMVNGLDRLSLVLLNSDIYAPDPIGLNFGLEFLANMGEAWGDVPFESRPPQIQAKYPKNGHTPCPTLAEAVADIQSTAQVFYDQMVGFPILPKCTEVTDPRDPKEVQLAETFEPTSEKSSDEDPKSDIGMLHISMYNISQTLSVLQENVDNGGMRVLRDLFFDLYYTGPAKGRNSNAGIHNNLSVVTTLVRVGILRQAGLRMLESPADDPATHGFFKALIEGAKSPATEPALSALFSEDPKQELIWNVLNQILELKNPQDIAHAKSIGFYAMAAIDSLGHADSVSAPNALLDPALKDLQPILKQYHGFLTQHTDLVSDFLKSSDVADFLRVLTEDSNPAKKSLLHLSLDALTDGQRGLDVMAILQALDSSPQVHQSWQDFRDRYKALDSYPEYRALNLNEIGRQGLNFLEGRTASGSPLMGEEAALARQLLDVLAAQMERDNMELIDQVLKAAARDPRQFKDLLQNLSKLIENGEIPHLLEIMRKTMEPAA